MGPDGAEVIGALGVRECLSRCLVGEGLSPNLVSEGLSQYLVGQVEVEGLSQYLVVQQAAPMALAARHEATMNALSGS